MRIVLIIKTFMEDALVQPFPRARSRWGRFVAVAGPGLVVMLADTDAGSIITAAQSGAQWGYRLLLLQAVLIPILFVVQELTVRLGIVTGQGHGKGIRQHFGPVWAWISVSTLLLACVGALVTELSGIAGVGALIGVPGWTSMTIVVAGLVLMAYTGSYLTVERIALTVGLFELVCHLDVSEALEIGHFDRSTFVHGQ